uniref:Integrator complex subunit 4 n=1 Tax=Leersia perrieri TaxID=77586 RepID=A0A0D9VSM8_9ORYZ
MAHPHLDVFPSPRKPHGPREDSLPQVPPSSPFPPITTGAAGARSSPAAPAAAPTMEEAQFLASSPRATGFAASSSSYCPDPMDEGPSVSVPGMPFAEQIRAAGRRASSGSPEGLGAQVQALASMSRGIYPLARAEALRSLAAVLETADARGGVVEQCYGCAAVLMRDEDEGVRLATMRLIVLCADKLNEGPDGDSHDHQMDIMFLQLSSMARDMCTKVRIEAFNALGKMQRVSEGVLLQSLSKKVIKPNTGSGSIIKGKKVPPKLIYPCAAGIFAHGIEDEFYQVRTAACKSLGALSKFSTQYAQKALDLLMGMMNDDTEAVRLQTLQSVFHMATYGCLSVQEMHMHMFLGLLVDTNVLIRNSTRKILGSVNLPKLQMFKSAIDVLITSLEKHQEISMSSDGELILDKPRIRALLIVSISVAFSDVKHNKLDIPEVIFSCAISLLGKISCAIGEVVDQNSLLSYLCQRTGIPFWKTKLASTESGESKGCSIETASDICAQIGKTGKSTKSVDEILAMQSVKSIIETVERTWTMRKSSNIHDVRTILRTCQEDLRILASNSSGSTRALLSFLCEYLDAVQFIIEILRSIQLDNSYNLGPTSLNVLLEKLDVSIRRMKCCYAGFNREMEIQVCELALLANLFELSKVGIHSKLVLDKLHWVINRLDCLCADGSSKLSYFSREIKKAFDANFVGHDIFTLLELFHPKPKTDYGMLKAISADLQVRDNDSENPSPYVCGLPVGVSYHISLYNISSQDRLWLRMIVGESIQHTFLELSCFGGNDEVKSGSMIVPLHITPMACSFVLRVCLVMECPFGSVSVHQEGNEGPRGSIVELSDELDVYFVCTERR